MDKSHYNEVALEIMKIVMQDNGAMNVLEKERYPMKHVRAISKACKKVFDAEPDLIDHDFLELMCAGDQDEFDEKYSHIASISDLQEAINDYFEQL